MTHASDTLFHVTPKTGALSVQWDPRDLVQRIAFTLGVFFLPYLKYVPGKFLSVSHTRETSNTFLDVHRTVHR
jgi:hypothetical protein